jgi:hypothetical protein
MRKSNSYLSVNKLSFIIVSKQTKEYIKDTKKSISIQLWKVINTDETNDFLIYIQKSGTY